MIENIEKDNITNSILQHFFILKAISENNEAAFLKRLKAG